MSSIPMYNAEENLRRIRRQKSLKFIVVEGIDDVPIYEYIIRNIIYDYSVYDIVHAGGKQAIKNFLEEHTECENCIFILDRDFDDIIISGRNTCFLERYSIENYYFSDDVISSAVAVSLKCKIIDAKVLVSLQEFYDENKNILNNLIKYIIYYQMYVVKNTELHTVMPGWSDSFICRDNDWRICQVKTQNLIDTLFPQGVVANTLNEFLAKNYKYSGDFMKDFPGKMLKTSLQRYLRQKFITLGKTGKFNNTDSTSELLTSHLHKCKELLQVLNPVIQFLS